MAAGGFLGSFRTRNDFVAPVMAKSISLAKQLAVQGSPAERSARTGVEFDAAGGPPRLRDICTEIRKS